MGKRVTRQNPPHHACTAHRQLHICNLLAEALLQAAIYCGMTTGMEGFKVVEKVINDVKA
jgi:hypothetical protein